MVFSFPDDEKLAAEREAKEKVELAKHVVAVLNRALESDPHAISALFENRVFCNRKLANDPTIQVREREGRSPNIGTLGIINGIVGINDDGYGFVAMEVERSQDGYKIVRFIIREA